MSFGATEHVICVHVAEKKDVPAGEKIPATIQGVRTDVHQTRIVPATDDQKYDPLVGGCRIGMDRIIYGELKTGTVGAVVADNASGASMILSNFHVMCNYTNWNGTGVTNKCIRQPPYIEFKQDGQVVCYVERAALDEQADCAVASIWSAI